PACSTTLVCPPYNAWFPSVAAHRSSWSSSWCDFTLTARQLSDPATTRTYVDGSESGQDNAAWRDSHLKTTVSLQGTISTVILWPPLSGAHIFQTASILRRVSTEPAHSM